MTLPYQLEVESKISIDIYDVGGRFVTNLVSDTQIPGYYSLTWDGKDRKGKLVATGIYFLSITVNKYEETKQIVWLR
jgi:flagellar hook assembly protein FlgD